MELYYGRGERARRRVGINGEASSAFGAGRTFRLAAIGKVRDMLPNMHLVEACPNSSESGRNR